MDINSIKQAIDAVVPFLSWPIILAPLFGTLFGYLIRKLPVTNNYIPICVTGVSCVSYPLLLIGTAPKWYMPGNWMLGAVLGFFMWTFHKAVLKDWEEKFPTVKRWLDRSDIDPDADTKPTTPPPMRLGVWFMPLLLLVLLTGCAGPNSTLNANSPAIKYTAAAVRALAKDGTYITLTKKPKSRAYFDATVVVFQSAIQSGNYDPVMLKQTLNTIPVTEVRDNDLAKLAIMDVLDLYQETYADVVSQKLDTLIWLKPVLQAAIDGIQKGEQFYDSGSN